MTDHLHVITRNGNKEAVSFDKILARIRSLAGDLEHVNPDLVAQKVCSQLSDEITTSQLDEFAAETCATMQTRYHPNYGTLAARIIVDNLHKNTPSTFLECLKILEEGKTVKKWLVSLAEQYDYQSMIDYSRDFMFDYFGIRTLEKGYTLKRNGKIIERPQHMWMRVAVELHRDDLPKVRETYDAMSLGYFTHATPTLYNAGTPTPQLSSCFLQQMKDDSIEGIYDTLKDCAKISKWAGGIGLSVHNVRAAGTRIAGTNGNSTGLCPMLKVFDDTAEYVNQGGKRKGSFAVYLEPWHRDIQDFLRLKLNQGAEEDRARHLFYALWIPDLFMRRVEEGGDWTLMCPHECPGLSDVWGAEFEKMYLNYELTTNSKKVKAKDIWQQILDTQIQTGMPYLCYKDAANSKSNQQHLGTIKSSNLCVAPETEIYVKKQIGEDNGYGIPYSYTPYEICELENKEVVIWNGNIYSKVTVKKTGIDQKLLKVVVSVNGIKKTLYCTEYHKFILPTDKDIVKCQRIEAQHLTSGQILMGYYDDCQIWISQKVVSVKFDGRYDNTYCFTEPLNNAGIFNGILTGNCTEIMEFTSPGETAVCNLGSLALPKFVKGGLQDGEWTEPEFDFTELRKYTSILTRNLDIVIDRTYYPTFDCRISNMKHRPIGVGVQGLADVFARMRISWGSEDSYRLNKQIFEHIYYACLETSCARSEEMSFQIHLGLVEPGYHPSFPGSPVSRGLLQFDMWGTAPSTDLDWTGIRARAKKGVRNSLLVAPMPTASTSQILGNNECFEPFTSNVYTRRVLAGEFIVINKHLVAELILLDKWNSDTRTELIANNGSVATLNIPDSLKQIYKTVWEIPQKVLINMSADRGPFICQSQSLNLFIADPSYSKLTSMHFYAWKQGLKTGCYYLRTKGASAPQQFTIEPCSMCTA